MHKIAYIIDSSVGWSLEEAKNISNLFVAPLSIIHENKEYLDQVELDYEDITEKLSRNEVIKTSQPNVGSMMELYKKVLKKDYDTIIAFTLTSHLSGTYNAFVQAKDMLGNPDNIVVIDTLSVAGVMQEFIKTGILLNEQGKSIDEIVDGIKASLKFTCSYLIPENLKQLTASGRISPAASAVASLLKMRVLLKIENAGTIIEKFATARTETKIIDAMIKDLKHDGFDPIKHKIYIAGCEAKEMGERIKARLNENFDNIEYYEYVLPAALSVHTGIGTTAIQWCLKAPYFVNHGV